LLVLTPITAALPGDLVVISTIPIVVAYLLMTRQFQSGLTAGALKG
jgi:ABC-type glycerol-3-phosphate transport system permease component